MLAPLAILSSLFAFAGVASAANITITVGGAAGLVYDPPSVTAQIGDLIIFDFKSKNHTVTQSTFASPCTLMKNATTNVVGFDSGYVPNPDSTLDRKMIIEVTVSTPLWFYCAQGTHCQAGMVGAINAVETGPKNFAAFKALAMGGTANATTTGVTTGAPAATLGGTATATGAVVSGAASASAAASAAASSGAAGTASSTGGASSLASLSSILLVVPLAFAGIALL
ncbi:Cupredoxin [Mrakia frigida]|uniref:cupredoxin domain-containing protein n=1 Tax=Mrakia frigida TaxID=29902 RepID=UPI003FCC1964